MNIYICDDEPAILNLINETISSYVPDASVWTFTSGIELVERLQMNSCDILFLDIDMPVLGGMDIAKQLHILDVKPLLVFVTSHDELVYESLQYHPFGFIRKTHLLDEMEHMLLDCKEELHAKNRHFCIKMTGQDVKLLLSDILYFEADSNYLKVYTKEMMYRFRSTLTAVENTLQQDGFLRVHKGFLVNVDMVKVLKKDELELLSGAHVPIGKSYADVTKKKLLESMRM
ncbi:MAG: response regulator transcription factor [Lachnospiraceae bacterium]|nr:response regulator transcription factor [Lachnospiraceae bacterium]